MKMLTTNLLLVSLLFSLLAAAAGGEYPLDTINVDFTDKASLQRGVKYYQNYCAGCHKLQFQRYERVADDLGIPHDLMMEHLVFNDSAKIGDLMDNSMDPKEASVWFGVSPPDLTLVTRVKGGPDWLYTYLKTFYEDPSRPYGVNNRVFPDVAMPHVLLDLQGVQMNICNDTKQAEGMTQHDNTMCRLIIDPKRTGSMTVAEYDQMVYDLTNFLAYSAEPMKEQRRHIGVYVFLFLAVFFVFAYLLKREYWKDTV